ncbi:MAG: tripartite tricarboxylate transporter TctB family protein [Candidatus Puniceispirillaceae bacterium]
MMMKTKYPYVIEWLFWVILVVLLWAQTSAFNEPIAEYHFGATGWPRMVLAGIFIGATGQMLLGVFVNKDGQDDQLDHDTKPEKIVKRWQQLAIFGMPFLYLWLMHRIGFFVATPLFIFAYLWVLEVRNIKHLLGVTIGVTAFIFFIFVRLFYVAMPVGSWLTFYEINNQIIILVRYGL